MRRSLNYLHTFWKQLFAYRNDGEYTTDNLAERTIRNMTIQRKNSLFFCSDKGARNSAIYNTFISTCPKYASDDNRDMKISEKFSKLTIQKFNDPALRAVKRVYTQFWTDTNNYKNNFFSRKGHCTNCLQIRQQLISDPGFGHIPIGSK